MPILRTKLFTVISKTVAFGVQTMYGMWEGNTFKTCHYSFTSESYVVHSTEDFIWLDFEIEISVSTILDKSEF